jgi:hypothetical protein
MQPASSDYAHLLQVLKAAQSTLNDRIQNGLQASSLGDLNDALSESIAQLEAMSALDSAITQLKTPK